MIIDIEVEVTEGFPRPELARNKIYSITIYDSNRQKYFCFVLDFENRIQNKKNKDLVMEVFSTERELINRFFKEYLRIKPTIITGWNSTYFDIPYLYNRTMKVIGMDVANVLSPIKIVEWYDAKKRYYIAGVSCLDYLMLYKKFTASQKPSYKLDNICETELNSKKLEFDGTLNELYANNIEKFIKYTIHDVRLVKKLDEKLDFIEIARGICHIGHIPYEDVFFSSRYLDGAILTYLKQLNIIAPSKLRNIKHDEILEGAFVLDPQRGRYRWIYNLDIVSEYPSIIRSLNLSPETKIGNIENWNPDQFLNTNESSYCVNYKDKSTKEFTKYQLKKYFLDNKVSISANGILYKTEKRGLIPTILTKWADQRVEFRELAKQASTGNDKIKYEYFDRRQAIQKILLNSLYGVLALPSFRFYDLENAAAVTSTGQLLIKFSKKIVNHFYNEELNDNKDYVLYIDTDSIYASALSLVQHRYSDSKLDDDFVSKHTLEITTEIQKYVNKSYDYFAKKFLNLDRHWFEIKQEVIAKSGIFITKKRYGLQIINKNGIPVDELYIKGMDIVRSDFPIAFKNILTEILKNVLDYVPQNQIDDKILEFQKTLKILDINKIANPTGVKGILKYSISNDKGFNTFKKGTPVHVKSSIAYNNLLNYFNLQNKYLSISEGEKIKWVYLKENPYYMDSIAIKGYGDPAEILNFIHKHIDLDKMIEKSLFQKIKPIYKTLDWNLPSLKQKQINKFFA